jgi:putative SOS response-associated peptidase YedK
VILRMEDYEVWLDAGARRPELLTPLLRRYSHEEMAAYAVSALVNSPSNNGPRCVEPLPGG